MTRAEHDAKPVDEPLRDVEGAGVELRRRRRVAQRVRAFLEEPDAAVADLFGPADPGGRDRSLTRFARRLASSDDTASRP